MSPSISTGIGSESVEDGTEIVSEATNYDYGGAFGARGVGLTKCPVMISNVERHVKPVRRSAI
jgi:hypothetical protein